MTLLPFSHRKLLAAALPLAGALPAMLLCAAAHAQAHQTARGGYSLRASTVVSTALDPATARSHGIEPAADRGVLDVTVERNTAPAGNVAADVDAVARDLTGVQQEIPMREARASSGMVSYVGTFRFASREVLDFHVTARPHGGAAGLFLRFRDRMPAVH